MTTDKQLRERREEVFIMVSKGMRQKEIAEKLNVTKSTISYDVKSIMENSDRKLTELVNKMLPFMYEKCINGINEVLREAWQIYDSDDPHISQWHRQAALRLAKDCNKDMFELFTNGPLTSQVKYLADKSKTIINDAISKGYIDSFDYPELQSMFDINPSNGNDMSKGNSNNSRQELQPK